MSTKKRNHSIDFKSKVGLEAIKEKQTIEEIAHKHEVHPSVVKSWKKQVVDNISKSFSGVNKVDKQADSLIEQLYSQIGKLKVENDFLKKKLW